MKRTLFNRHPLRLTPLAACFALVFAAGSATQNVVCATPNTPAQAQPWQSLPLHEVQTAHAQSAPHHPATTYEVTSCADDGSPGTLRYVIAHAGDGDTADLGNLTCSTITLATGEILIPQNNFVLQASRERPITIDAHGASRVIEHDGTGILGLVNLDLANGYFKYNSGTGSAKGGCVLSNGPIGMTTTNVSACTAVNLNGQVEGGAIYALGDINAMISSNVSGSTASGLQAFGGGIFSTGSVYLDYGTVSGNRAVSTTDAANVFATAGGIWAENGLRIIHSSISGNQAEDDHGSATGGGLVAGTGAYLAFSAISGNTAVSATSTAGGVAATGNSYIYYSTLDHNQAVNNAALVLGGTSANVARIGNSTISTNTATTGSTAVFTSIPLFVNNSTIAFNVAAGTSAGLYLYPGGTTDLESTIIANNTSSAGGGFDVVARADITGAHNLILNPGTTVPADTLTGIDPRLEPLASNSSFNVPLTNALAPTSPAIDRGSNPRNFNYDERGPFNARVFGISADIGAYEWDGTDTDTIFANGFE